MASHRFFGTSPVPRYVQLADLLRQRIARGHWPIGAQLPTLPALMAEFDVARVTVRQAVELLAREGLLSAQQGRGTFVTGGQGPARSLHLATSLQALADVYRHDRPQLTLVEESRGDPPVREGEGRAAAAYRFMRRIHSRDRVNYCVIAIWIEASIFRMAPRRFRNETVIPVLLDIARDRIAQARQTVTVSGADAEVARHLGIARDAPVALVRRVFLDAQGQVIYLGEVVYRGDHVRFEMDLNP